MHWMEKIVLPTKCPSLEESGTEKNFFFRIQRKKLMFSRYKKFLKKRLNWLKNQCGKLITVLSERPLLIGQNLYATTCP